MGNRFTFKDLVFVALMLVGIASVLLAMWQFSYQEERLTSLKVTLERIDKNQKDQVVILERLERNGVQIGNATTGSSNNAGGITYEKRPDGSLFVSAPRIPSTPRDPRSFKDYARGDWIIRNLGSEPNIITPYIYKDAYGQDAQVPVVESLTTLNLETWRQDPWLAESYLQSADGLTFTFVLRKEARWSDGQPVTADDVVFSYKTIVDPKIDAPSLRSYVEQITSCEKIDDRTVVMKFGKPYFKALEIAGNFVTVIPKHIYQYTNPEDYNSKRDKLIGSGPYTVKWETGQQLVYTRNDLYWGPRPTFDKLVFKFIKNPQAALQEFVASKMDMFDALPDQFEKYSADTEFTKTHTLYKYPTPQSGYSFVGWNLAKPQFKDKETRRALTMALDRDSMINSFLKGMAIPTSGPFSPQSQQYNQACLPLPYDIETSRKLLAQAGWKANSRGILERDGVEFKFDLSMGSGNPLGERIAAYLKEQFRTIGIDMSIQPFEFSVLMERMDKRNFDAIFMGWTANIESDPYQTWHSSQIADQGDNVITFRNLESDRIIDAARAEMDTEKRMKLWQEFHKIIYDEQPYTFLYSRMEKIFIDGRFKNTEPYKTGTNSDDWYVPSDKQKYK